jgi:hypothetical protein
MGNPINIVFELQNIVIEKFKIEKTKVTDDEKLVAQKLFNYLDEILNNNYYSDEYLEQSDIESDYDFEFGVNNCNNKRSLESDSEYEYEFENQTIKQKFTFDQMKNIASYSKLSDGSFRKFSSIQNRYRKLNNMREVYRIIEYVGKGGTNLQKFKQIENFVYGKYKNSRNIEKLPGK